MLLMVSFISPITITRLPLVLHLLILSYISCDLCIISSLSAVKSIPLCIFFFFLIFFLPSQPHQLSYAIRRLDKELLAPNERCSVVSDLIHCDNRNRKTNKGTTRKDNY